MNSSNPLYMPYGAYEMKATYQRNMLMGMLITTGLVITTLVSSWLLSRGEEATPLVPPDPSREEIKISVQPPASIIVERGPVHPAFAEVVRPGIPVPVDDDEIGDLEAVIPTHDQLAAIIDSRYSEMGTGDGDIGVIDDFVDYIPGPTEIVFTEIYPEFVHQVRPEYPRFAQSAGLEGTVHVKALVMPDGSVRDAMIFKSSGVKSLDEAALSVAKQNVFKPGVQNGRPVACWVVYRVEFELSQ